MDVSNAFTFTPQMNNMEDNVFLPNIINASKTDRLHDKPTKEEVINSA